MAWEGELGSCSFDSGAVVHRIHSAQTSLCIRVFWTVGTVPCGLLLSGETCTRLPSLRTRPKSEAGDKCTWNATPLGTLRASITITASSWNQGHAGHGTSTGCSEQMTSCAKDTTSHGMRGLRRGNALAPHEVPCRKKQRHVRHSMPYRGTFCIFFRAIVV